jgi:hypothetical protein
MYLMRPAVPGDRSAISRLVDARREWLVNRGHYRLPADPAAIVDTVGLHSDDGRPLTWVALDGDVLCGVTRLQPDMPNDTWTGTELHEPALLLTDTWTHPNTRSDRLGALIAWWSLGYAAHQHMVCVRRIATVLLVDRCQQQGWTTQRTEGPGGSMKYLLTRPAEPMRGLGGLIAGGEPTPVPEFGPGEAQWTSPPSAPPGPAAMPA